MSTHIFGPIPSRRLGVSLGIDLTPDKHCTMNCVYCECGKTDHLTTARAEFVPTGDVIDELRAYLGTQPTLDSVTFSGSGEPTLHAGIGRVIAFLKDEFPRYRVTVLTNSSLLPDPQVRAELARADLVVPSLDAVSDAAFRRIDRPHAKLRAADIIDGLRAFCADFAGEVWIELFVVPGVNDTVEELTLFRDTLATIRHDRVQLNTLDRPGAVDWIRPVSADRLDAIAAMLGGRVDIIASRGATDSTPSRVLHRDLLLATLQVRPCTREDLRATLHADADALETLLRGLEAEGRIERVTGERGEFLRARGPR